MDKGIRMDSACGRDGRAGNNTKIQIIECEKGMVSNESVLGMFLIAVIKL